MQITFQTPQGTRYSAEVVDDKLTNVQKLEDKPQGGGGAGSPPPSGGKPQGQEQAGGGQMSPSQENGEKQKKSDSNGGGGDKQEPPIPEDRVFIEHLQAVLVNNRARKQLRNKQKGSLDMKALVRTQTDSQSVFKQNNRKDSHRNYSVMLLVDESGSMRGEKAELAKELTTNISQNLERVGGVETAVVGFSGNRIVEHKRFDNSGHNSLCCIADFAESGTHCSIGEKIRDAVDTDHQNADLIAMEYALDYLHKQKAHNSRPIFVMLSDGAPCGSHSEISVVTADIQGTYFESKFIKDDTDTRSISSMHRLIARYPEVNAFGLGMQRGGQQVPKHKVVQDIKETKSVLLDFLRTSIQ